MRLTVVRGRPRSASEANSSSEEMRPPSHSRRKLESWRAVESGVVGLGCIGTLCHRIRGGLYRNRRRKFSIYSKANIRRILSRSRCSVCISEINAEACAMEIKKSVKRLAAILGWAMVGVCLPVGVWWCYHIPTPGKGGLLLAFVATVMPLVWED